MKGQASETRGAGSIRVVVMIDSIGRPGGGERLAAENAIRLDPAQFERTLCITRWEDGLDHTEPASTILGRLSDAGVRVIKLRRGSRRRSGLAPAGPGAEG